MIDLEKIVAKIFLECIDTSDYIEFRRGTVEMSCQHEVKPLPYGFCVNCSLNGCYPWNRTALLLCAKMGGLHPAIIVTKQDELFPEECASFTLVTEKTWEAHLSDLRREAMNNEEVRLRARDGKVMSSELLPAEYVQKEAKK